jgi:hypothetical protein
MALVRLAISSSTIRPIVLTPALLEPMPMRKHAQLAQLNAQFAQVTLHAQSAQLDSTSIITNAQLPAQSDCSRMTPSRNAKLANTMCYKAINALLNAPKSMVLKKKPRVANLVITNAALAPPELNAQAAIRDHTTSKELATQLALRVITLILKMPYSPAKCAMITSITTNVW